MAVAVGVGVQGEHTSRGPSRAAHQGTHSAQRRVATCTHVSVWVCAQHIHDTYWLVNVVDNAYADPSSDIFAIFKDVIHGAMTRKQLLGVVSSLQRQNDTLRQQMRSLALHNVRHTTAEPRHALALPMLTLLCTRRAAARRSSPLPKLSRKSVRR